jgi:hypothetical protein
LAATSGTIWRCPTCGDGKRGPRRPRRNNVVRYCLPCSGKAGVLVERVAPAVERQREANAAKAAAKRRAKEGRERAKRAAYYTVDGVNLHDEMVKLCRLPAFGGRSGRMAKNPPKLRIRRAAEPPRSRYGIAWWFRNEIQVTTWPTRTRYSALETLLHELVHVYTRYDCDRPHDKTFKRKFRDAAHEAWGILKWPEHAYHGTYEFALAEKARAEGAAQ